MTFDHQKSRQFLIQSKWLFVPNLEKFPRSIPEIFVLKQKKKRAHHKVQWQKWCPTLQNPNISNLLWYEKKSCKIPCLSGWNHQMFGSSAGAWREKYDVILMKVVSKLPLIQLLVRIKGTAKWEDNGKKENEHSSGQDWENLVEICMIV